MDVADLSSREAVAFAGGISRAFDEPGIGDKVLDGGETVDVVDFVEDDQGEDLADAGHGTDQKEILGIMLLGRSGDIELHVGEQFVVVGDKDVVILKRIAHPAMRDFDELVRQARRQARDAGMKRSDVKASVQKVRKRH
mgnify:CR=1 FL=1